MPGHKMENNQKGHWSPTFKVCVPKHVSLQIFIMQVLTSQLQFLANRNVELAVPPLLWPVNCIKIGRHVVLLSGPTVYSQTMIVSNHAWIIQSCELNWVARQKKLLAKFLCLKVSFENVSKVHKRFRFFQYLKHTFRAKGLC